MSAMHKPSEQTHEETNEQTMSTLESLKGSTQEQPVSTTSDNPLFRPGNDNSNE